MEALYRHIRHFQCIFTSFTGFVFQAKLEYDPSVDETAKKLYKNLSAGKMGDNSNGQGVAIQENMAVKSAVAKSREKVAG